MHLLLFSLLLLVAINRIKVTVVALACAWVYWSWHNYKRWKSNRRDI